MSEHFSDSNKPPLIALAQSQTQMTVEWNEDDKDRSRGQSEKLLQILKRGGEHTNTYLSRCGLIRYGANLKTLREDGYEILTRSKGHGIFTYELIGYSKTVRIGESDKELYWKSAHWHNKRNERKTMDGYRCCWCKTTGGDGNPLQVHHWQYDLFNEDIRDLMTLCRECHGIIHSYDNVQIHFPHTVPESVYCRIHRNE